MKITIDIDGQEKTFDIPTEADRAEAWELRCEELEQELRDAQETNTGLGEIIVARDSELRTLNKANREMDEEIRVLRNRLDIKCVKHANEKQDLIGQVSLQDMRICKLTDENRELWERIQEQDVTIAKYDDENRELHNKLEKYETEAANLVWKWDRGSTALTRWAKAIHENAVAHGWWTGIVHGEEYSSIREDVERPLPEILMLCVCELAESMEEYRNGKPLIYDGEDGKPEGIAVEMVDCIIRILDWMGHNGVDVDAVLRRKHEYNKSRPYRHGGKKA